MTTHQVKAIAFAALLSGCATAQSETSEVGWNASTPPTPEQKAMEARREASARHRAASASLREAEARACAGIPEPERDVSPFAHVHDISAVRSFSQQEWTDPEAGEMITRTGVLVTFEALPGLSTEWLQRLVDCQLARDAALGAAANELPDDPLVPGNLETHVFRTHDGFVVSISSLDPKVGKEIQARARLLKSAAKAAGAAPPP